MKYRPYEPSEEQKKEREWQKAAEKYYKEQAKTFTHILWTILLSMVVSMAVTLLIIERFL